MSEEPIKKGWQIAAGICLGIFYVVSIVALALMLGMAIIELLRIS